jgi:protein-tyrosine phosphatase
VATPHVSHRYDNKAETIIGLVEELSGRLQEEGIELELRPGAEIAVARANELDPAELSRLGLGGAGQWVLVEPPFSNATPALGHILLDLQARGHRILLAHPERCPAFHRDPALLEALVEAGILTSITASSLGGQFGETVHRFALKLAREGMIHNVASDAHDHLGRPPLIATHLELAGLGPLSDWLTREVPSAILDGGEIPPRPQVSLSIEEPKSRGGWWRRLSQVAPR